MARVTVEDCIEKVSSPFELVMLASQRARKIGSGAALLVERDNDKNPVISLREIAEDKVTPEDLKEELIQSNQHIIEMDDSEDVIDSMEGEEEWNAITSQRSSEGQFDDITEDELSKEPSLNDLAGGGLPGEF